MNIADALLSLRPGAEWVLRGDELEWLDTKQTQPTEAEIQAEITRLQAEFESKAYQRSRAAEYPAIGDQLDALWKGGAAAEEMLAAVMAVKSKYPKPE
jgi:uncharacterized small protein (DUF1192 family)